MLVADFEILSEDFVFSEAFNVAERVHPRAGICSVRYLCFTTTGLGVFVLSGQVPYKQTNAEIFLEVELYSFFCGGSMQGRPNAFTKVKVTRDEVERTLKKAADLIRTRVD